MYLRNNGPDIGCLLAGLADSIRNFRDEADLYLNHIGEYEAFNPFQPGGRTAFKETDESIPREFWERLGIRYLISNAPQSGMVTKGGWHIENRKMIKNRVNGRT